MAKLVCWNCGGSLREVPRPIRRLTRCSRCRADLHVCRLCRHWDPEVLGECRHERAERVADKASANFCTHYRPRPAAHRPPRDGRAGRTRAALDDLFGIEPDQASERAPLDPGARALDQAARAKEELRALFDLGDAQRDDE